MPTRFVIVLFVFGIFLQGCSLQKRSLMPGWHVERLAKASTTPDESAVEGANHTAVNESFKIHAESTAPLQDPLIPMKALMAYSPAIEGIPELRIPHIPQPVDAFEALPITNAGIAGHQVTRNAKAPFGLIAALLYVLSAVIGAGGFFVILLGSAFGDSEVILVGALALAVSYSLFFAARNPNSRWRRRAVERHRERLLDRVDRSEERAAERAEYEAELEVKRAARQEELRLKEENRRNVQEAEQQARKTKRQAFFQDPFVTIALGFSVIIGLYLALF